MIKIAHLNIQTDKHLKRFIPFFQSEKPDILMMQEVVRKNINEIKEKLGFKHAIYQEMYYSKKDSDNNQGLVIFTNLDYLHAQSVLLGKQFKGIHHPEFFSEIDFYLLVLEFGFFGKKYYIGTTHFPVTDEGMESELQNSICDTFIEEVKKYENILISGDFNAPRHRKVFTRISEVLKDNIPEEVTTTIDQKLHRKKGIQFVVDGMFTKGEINLENVRLHDGVSDHVSVLAEITNLNN